MRGQYPHGIVGFFLFSNCRSSNRLQRIPQLIGRFLIRICPEWYRPPLLTEEPERECRFESCDACHREVYVYGRQTGCKPVLFGEVGFDSLTHDHFFSCLHGMDCGIIPLVQQIGDESPMKFNNNLSVMRPHLMRLSSHYGLLFFVMKYQYKARKVNGKRIDEHRLVAIQHWGEEACKGMDVHHKNGDKLDNRIENLELIPRSRHSQKHMLGRTLPEETRKKLSIATLNYFKTHTMSNKKMVGQFSLSCDLLAVYESCSSVSYYGFESQWRCHK